MTAGKRGDLGHATPSSLIDLGSSFAVMTHMRPVPIDKLTLVTLAVAGRNAHGSGCSLCHTGPIN
jgi:hypothetical protein